MKHSIFIKTYEKDLEWCKFGLLTLLRFAQGFHEIVIAGPPNCRAPFEKRNGVVFSPTADKGNGYIYQQYVKMMADTMVTGDVVHYVDSDCYFVRNFSPSDFMRDEKPILYVTPFSEVGTGNVWKDCTEKALKWECHFETMRRLPWLCPTALLPEFRKFIEQTHGTGFRNWALSKDGSIQNALSEFNAMGNFFLKCYPDHFYVLDTTREPLPYNPCIQKRSWDGFTEEVRREIEGVMV